MNKNYLVAVVVVATAILLPLTSGVGLAVVLGIMAGFGLYGSWHGLFVLLSFLGPFLYQVVRGETLEKSWPLGLVGIVFFWVLHLFTQLAKKEFAHLD